jgi:transposase
MRDTITSEKKMTVKEVADVLGCKLETVKKWTRKLYPGLMENGKTTYLSETQITVILEKIKRTTAEHRGKKGVDLQRSVAGAETSQSLMSVHEIAVIFGVSDEAIKKHIRELYPEILRNGITTYLSVEQITAIKQRMLPTTKVVAAITDLEAAEMLIKSAEHFKARFEQEHNMRIKAETAFGREVLAHQETRTGLETYQRYAETHGLAMSDHDDLLATYKRG